jgi:hypothetical protein
MYHLAHSLGLLKEDLSIAAKVNEDFWRDLFSVNSNLPVSTRSPKVLNSAIRQDS